MALYTVDLTADLGFIGDDSRTRIQYVALDSALVFSGFDGALDPLNVFDGLGVNVPWRLHPLLSPITGSFQLEKGKTGSIAITMPKVRGVFTALITSNAALAATLPVLRPNFVGGIYTISGSLPAVTGSFTGLPGLLGTLAARAPSLVFSSTGVASTLAALSANLPRLSASFNTTVGNVVQLNVSMRRMTAQFTGAIGVLGVLDGVLGALTAALGAHTQVFGAMAVQMPRLTVSLFGRTSVTQVLTLVVNTITNAPVMYEHYPYNSFAEFGGKYLAAGPDGLFQVEVGAKDVDGVTELPINWNMTTGDISFGSEFIKRISDFYAAMRAEGDIKVIVQADEGDPYEYILSPMDVAALKQRRTAIGKGLRGKYFTFSITDIDGKDIEFDTMNVAAVPTARRI